MKPEHLNTLTNLKETLDRIDDSTHVSKHVLKSAVDIIDSLLSGDKKKIYKIRNKFGAFYAGHWGQWNRKGKAYSQRGHALNALNLNVRQAELNDVHIVTYEINETEVCSESAINILQAKEDKRRVKELKYKKARLENQLQSLPKERKRIDEEIEKVKRELESICES